MSNVKCQICNKGLTLVEVLVAMGIVTVTGVLLVAVIVNSTGVFSKQSSKIQTGVSINDSLMQIRGAIKQASGIAETLTQGSATYTTGSDQLILKVISIDSSNNIIEETFDYFVIFQDQNILRFKIFPDAQSSRSSADKILSVSLDGILFQYFNSGIPPSEVTPAEATKIRVSLKLKQKAGSSFEINTATSEANLRNNL
ncbi:hypothetical protein HYS95_00575 [Candidatus Daviesbacteria bacterium]|nr:hypothetical protein [Candidatus Daviesbacteria bacterium]